MCTADQSVQEHSLGDLSDDLLLLVFAKLNSRHRRRAAPTCKRWAQLISALQTGLKLLGPADLARQQGGLLGKALSAALAARSGRLSWLYCHIDNPADLVWQTLVVGQLAESLTKLELTHGDDILHSDFEWLAALPKLEDFTLMQYNTNTAVLEPLNHATFLTKLMLVFGPTDIVDAVEVPLSGLTRLRKLFIDALAINIPLHHFLPHNLHALAITDGSFIRGGLSSALLRLTALTSLCLTTCISLEAGDMQNLPLTSLPGLKVLRLDCCRLQDVPEQLADMTGLQVLNLRGNGLVQLPEEGAFLRDLQALDVSSNRLAKGVPPFLQHAPALELLIWTNDEHMIRSRAPVGPGGQSRRLATSIKVQLPPGTVDVGFEESAPAIPQLHPLWKLLSGAPEDL